jgi:diguanylate cyclase (GGDEF)-like protein
VAFFACLTLAPIAQLEDWMDASTPQPTPGSVDDVLAKGHLWLRFPANLETLFQSEMLEPRRRLLTACGLLGVIGIVVGSANLSSLSPDIVEQVKPILGGIILSILLCLTLSWFAPKQWRRPWHAEALTAGNALSVIVLLIWMGTASRVDTTFTHLATIASVVTYACIAARQRFFWSLGLAVLSFVGCMTFVSGYTPVQALVMSGNVKLMVLTYTFALMANYAFEHNERRAWLLRKQQVHQRGVLREASDRLQRLSLEDGLTGLFNRRKFDADLALAWSEAATTGQPLAILLLDVDFFKRYNDTYGHEAGDTCLITVSQALAQVAHAFGGTAARLGGEEFGVLLPGLTLDQAQVAAAALCKGVRGVGIPHSASEVSAFVTASVGVAQAWPAQGGNPQCLVEAADRGLYSAKDGGRDRACAATLTPSNTAEPLRAQTPAPAADVVSAMHEALQSPDQAYAQTLHGKFRWLRFPDDMEARYHEQDFDHRRKVLAAMAVVGLVIYNLFVYSSRAMFPDVQAGVLMAQYGLSALMLVLTIGSYNLQLPYIWREAIFSFGTALMAVVSTWVLSQSQQLSAFSCALCLVLIPMFSGVAARQPFWFTCGPAVITPLAFCLLFKPVGEVQTMVYIDDIFVIVNSTVYTLILAYTLEYGARKDWLLLQIERLQREALHVATRYLHELSVLDPLTGISNRRQFEDDFQRTWAESLKARRSLAMVIIDVDFFKLFNDGYGHPAGDRCLKQVAAAISQTAQASKGLAARLGGEEFGILLPGFNMARAVQVAERICEAVRQAGIEHRYTKVAGQVTVTVSVGVCSMLPDAGTNPRSLLTNADDALYRAKHSGRNRVATGAVQTVPLAMMSVS